MEKIDLRELSKMAKSFRACHRALKKLKEGEGFHISFFGSYRRKGTEIPIPNPEKAKGYITEMLESQLAQLRKRFAEMGIDPLEIDGRKKKAVPLKSIK